MEKSKDIFRATRSICPLCCNTVKSVIIEEDGKVFLRKDCPSCGISNLLLSKSPAYYRELDLLYFNIMNQDRDLPETEVYLTYRCNMKCPICYLEISNQDLQCKEPTCDDIESYIKNSSKTFFILTGGEPTCRDDLADIIGLFKKHSRSVSINTNGIRLADKGYLSALIDAGLDRVNLQLDSFDPEIEKELRGHNYLEAKMKAINNLRDLGVSTGINCVVVKGINDKKLGEMANFVANNHFIKAINFLAIAFIGSARDNKLDNYIMPDELVDLLDKQTEGLISREQVFLFQKLHLTIKSFFSQRFCFYSQSYVAVRTKSGYEPLGNFLNFNKMESCLFSYRKIYNKNKLFSAFFLSAAIASLFLKLRSVVIMKEIFLMGISYFFKSPAYLKSSRFFYINFTTGCDRYKKDYSIARNCHSEVACFDRKSGAISHMGRATDFYLNREDDLSLESR